MEVNKKVFFEEIAQELSQKGVKVISTDQDRPWGGFFVIDEEQAQYFADLYFNGIDVKSLKISGKLSPKILVVAPHQSLSWQYHYRRAEIWQVVKGTVGIVRSDDDTEGRLKEYKETEQVILKQGERHRLIGLDDWGVVAEIWQHTDAEKPSDEDDIVRVQDDFGR